MFSCRIEYKLIVGQIKLFFKCYQSQLVIRTFLLINVLLSPQAKITVMKLDISKHSVKNIQISIST